MSKAKKKSGQRRKKKTPSLIWRLMSGSGHFVARHPAWIGGPLVFGVVFSFVSANALWYQPGPHPGPLLKTRQPSDPYAVPGRRMIDSEQAFDTFRIERETDGADVTIETASLEGGAVRSDAPGDSDSLMAILQSVEANPPMPAANTQQQADVPEAPGMPEMADEGKATDLEAVQTALATLGYYKGTPDGLSGPMTEKAIRAFQSDKGLAVTGVADDKVIAVLFGSGDTLPPVPTPRPDEVATTGSGSDAVAAYLSETADAVSPTPDPMVIEIQRGLVNIAYSGISVDGVAGPGTTKAIRAFQRDYRLPQTGNPDVAVLDKLKEIGAL